MTPSGPTPSPEQMISRANDLEALAALPACAKARRAELQYQAMQLRRAAIALKEGN
jgi:hypothetical protein